MPRERNDCKQYSTVYSPVIRTHIYIHQSSRVIPIVSPFPFLSLFSRCILMSYIRCCLPSFLSICDFFSCRCIFRPFFGHRKRQRVNLVHQKRAKKGTVRSEGGGKAGRGDVRWSPP